MKTGRGRRAADAFLKLLVGMTERELRMMERLEARGLGRFYKAVSSGQITRYWFPIPVAAAVLKVSPRRVYQLIKKKKLRSRKIVWSDGNYSENWVTAASVARYAMERYTK